MTVKRVRYNDSDLVIEITYDWLEPLTARAVGNVSGFGSSPETDRAVAFALTQAITAYKNNSLADRNKENAKNPRKSRMVNPTPDEVFSAMRSLRIVDAKGNKLITQYRDKLLKHLLASFPTLSLTKLKARIERLRDEEKIR